MPESRKHEALEPQVDDLLLRRLGGIKRAPLDGGPIHAAQPQPNTASRTCRAQMYGLHMLLGNAEDLAPGGIPLAQGNSVAGPSSAQPLPLRAEERTQGTAWLHEPW